MPREKERKKRGTENLGKATVDMTSMIDVTFQLIIFFILQKFKTLEAKLPAYLPKDVGVNTSKAEPMEKLDVHIYCTQKGTKREIPGSPRHEYQNHKLRWVVNGIPYHTKGDLERALKELSKTMLDDEDKPVPVTLHAHQDVFYGDVTETVDIAVYAGFEEVTFAGGHTK